MTENTTLRMKRTFEAPAQAVFDAWTSEEVMRRWWDGDTTRQLIELDFEETDGVTTVRFTHSGLWNEDAVRSHEDGWGKAFDNLERTLGAGR